MLLCIASPRAHGGVESLEHVATFQWPTATFGPSQTFTRIVAGNIIGNGTPDAVAMSGSMVVFFNDVACEESMSLVPRLANDIEIVKTTERGYPDKLALTTSAGLEVLHWSPAHDLVPGAFVSDMVVTGSWVNARMVRSADLNETGSADFVGVGANGKTLIRRRDAAGTGDPEEVTITLSRTIVQLQILRWQTGTPLAIAVLTSAGLDIYDQDLGLVDSFPGLATPGGMFAVVHTQGTADQIAWILQDSAGVQRLVTERAAGGAQTPVFLPTDHHAVAVAAGDINGDGRDDLVVTHTYDYAPLYFEHPSDTDRFRIPPTSISCDPVLSAVTNVTNQAQPLVMDIDLDGYADVVVPVQDTNSFSVELRDMSLPSLQSGPFFLVDSTFEPGTGTSRDLHLRFEFETLNNPPATLVEIVVWLQHGYSGPVESSSFDHRIYTLPAPTSNLDGVPVAAEMNLDVGETDPCFDSIFWFEVRAASVKDGVYMPEGPTQIAALVSRADWAFLIAAGGGILTMANQSPGCTILPSGGADRAPCIIPKRQRPSSGPGGVPTVKPPSHEATALIEE